ncbi:O-antigen ligase family protein [Pedobacter frigoris]|uniref:O-antigen ligase family protein n=1 Tax=Pedobacter frigoris TaxID=2571272 RepID=UPI0029317EBA|nr:O-antigen ligase family protein [Pedobacter frigoris]
MSENLIFILAALTLLMFVLNVFYNGNTVESCLIFILTCLPLMNLKITPEAMGGFKTFDFICFYGLIFLLKDFTTIQLKTRQNFYFVFFVILSIILVIGGLASEFPNRTFFSFIKFLSIFIFGRFLLISCYKDPSFHQRVIAALKASYLMALVFLGLQFIFGLGFTFYPKLGPNTIDPIFHMVRFPGIFYDSQAHGQYLAMGSFLFLYVEEGTKRNVRLLNYLVFILAVIGLNLAGSRAPIGGFVIGLFAILFILSGKYRLYGGIVIVLAITFYMVIAPTTGVFQRAENLSEDYLFRKNLWEEALVISQENSLLGIGSGNYQDHITRHNQDQYLEIEDGLFLYFDQPENGYLKILVEFGYIGFGVFALMLIIPLLKAIIGYFRNTFDRKVIFLMASLLSWAVAFSTVYSISDYRIMIVMAVMIILIISYPEKQTTAEDEA